MEADRLKRLSERAVLVFQHGEQVTKRADLSLYYVSCCVMIGITAKPINPGKQKANSKFQLVSERIIAFLSSATIDEWTLNNLLGWFRYPLSGLHKRNGKVMENCDICGNYKEGE